MASKRSRDRNPLATLTLIADLLGPALRKNGLGKEYQHWRIFSLWEKTVGRSIALHSLPHRFERGVFWVIVASSAWMQELQFMKQEIIERLNRELELQCNSSDPQLKLDALRVSAMKFTVGKITRPKETAAPVKAAIAPLGDPSPEQLAFADQVTSETSDPELKEIFRQTLLRVNLRRGMEKKI